MRRRRAARTSLSPIGLRKPRRATKGVGEPAKMQIQKAAEGRVPTVAWPVGPTLRKRVGEPAKMQIQKAAEGRVPTVAWPVGPTLRKRVGGPAKMQIQKAAEGRVPTVAWLRE